MIRPLFDKVLVKPVKVGEQTRQSGIVLPSQETDTHKAEVIAVGGEVEHIAEGDVVVVTRYAGDQVEFNQEFYQIMEERAILAKIAE